VPYDDFAYIGIKAIERPVFLLASVELASRSGIVALIRFPLRGFVFSSESRWGSLLFQRSFLARHPLRRFAAAPGALKENRVFPAIQRGADRVDMHGLKDVAGRAIDPRSKAMADACKWS
jgi:hypothetical protein